MLASTGTTYDRILAASVMLFNEFGAPNVSTTVIANAVKISPGNLYYHFRNKDHIIESLFAKYEHELGERFNVSPKGLPAFNAMWASLHSMYAVGWKYRFVYRDMCNLLSRNRMFETRIKQITDSKTRIARALCNQLQLHSFIKASDREIESLSINMTVIGSYWLGFEYVCNPRSSSDTRSRDKTLDRGCYHVLSLLLPYMNPQAKQSFQEFASFTLARSRRC